ncbi:monovalent cation/H(+) antiporter subunit G [Geodermatophilus sp. YIM 151500]|uniref:monovalent cation/H(+) antiporter subunit G n=1 Tax=Geodermatophilus sp. YIM 151500 TaxID=2984531 RepID=UPI0021E47A54|nr:monovalent cation/H(+) antiporter subunit G [Geodermatophilus sp. YIM 151500]MCV2491056.1 monovalent cation/H(+) antiporter subunit G [Geodermatophilus sp. YIM 151500]
MSGLLDAVAAVLLLLGALLCLTAGLGLVRFHDVLSRMHAGTKPQVMGVLLILAGAAIRLRGSSVVWMLLLVAVFQLLTAPLAAHLVSRIAYRRRHVRRDLLLVAEIGFEGFGQPLPADAPQGDEPAEAVTDTSAPSGGSSRAREG